ncbi:membrane-anchored ubiquitin-fold protein 2-like [Bidens hawaiensis]|uniref:membrane-anchored ubiquitin-fold protein 2-like n=1 Tax=Bidens hawaiensis TaxID=980011 RepID=UPI0040493703
MSEVLDLLEIKFRLIDGSDIGPLSFPAAATGFMLKECIISEWPKDKANAPKTSKDLKIISAGKILENHKTVGECRSALCDVPGGITTMHVVVSQPAQEKEKKVTDNLKQKKCGCVIL